VEVSLIIEQIGKFHPILVHFPVALICFLPLVLIASNFEFGKIWRPTIPYFVHLGSLSSIATSFVGYLWMWERETISNQLMWHRNLGFATTAIMVVISVFIFFRKTDFEKERPRIVLLLSLAAIILLHITAHLGGTLVHGEFLILFGGDDF
jgi:uncharacterized membrane protein